MSLWEIVALCVPVAVGWFWLDSLRARDLAVTEARRACQLEDLQFLDESVAGEGVRLGRNDDGQMQIRREYRFEYSDTGNNRQTGRLVLLGHRVELVNTRPASVTYLN